MIAETAYPALVLNADFNALSYNPLSTWKWEDAVKAVLGDRVMVICEYDREIRSESQAIRLPSVIALKSMAPLPSSPVFTRRNLFIYFRQRCAYCGERLTLAEVTFDHVMPRSKGGSTGWNNIVASCGRCNSFKANRTPRQAGMTLLQQPREPNYWEFNSVARQFPPPIEMHQDWLDYLYWESELEHD